MMDFPKYESYKDSGIAWLGEIPQNWEIIRSKYVFSEIDERSQTGNEELLSVSHLTGVTPRSEKNVNMFLAEDYTGAKLCQPNDVVINTMWAWMGALGVSDHTGLVSPSYGVYRPNEKVYPRFLDSLLRTPQYIAEYIRRSTGIQSSRLRLYSNQFLDIPLVMPPIEEQRRIVDFLDRKTAEIDQAIAQKQRLIELLKEQKTILIDRAVTQGLNPNVLVRDSDIEWIGKVPKHWKLVQNRYVFQEQNKRSANGNEIHLSMSQKFGLVPSHELESKTLQSESYEGAKLCLKTDLILNRLKAHLGVFSVAPCDGLVSPDYSVFRLRNQNMTSKYFEHLFKTAIYISEFNRKVKGIVMGFYRLYSDSFNEIPCLCPPIHEQVQIQNWILEKQQEFKIVENAIRTEIDRLLELKSVVISEAVTGKIKV